MRFVDEIRITVASGKGGDGAVSFLREAFRPRGGPDGGNGGKGGDVMLEATPRRNTLVDFKWNKVYRAEDGRQGGSRQMTGRGGEDLILPVPVGTQVRDQETRELLADLAEAGDRWVLEGGRGGIGNVAFKSSTRRTPRFATEGKEGQQRSLHLELKLIADVGLLGFPNAGKSTLISCISAAKPKIADYPFTTLVPNLGVVRVGDGQSFVVADIPGLIEGAAEGAGLGHRFLKHVERCACYIHLVSADEPDDSTPLERFRALNDELRNYDEDLLQRPQLIALSKTDLLQPDEVEALRADLEKQIGTRVFAISSVTGDGLKPLAGEAWNLVQKRASE